MPETSGHRQDSPAKRPHFFKVFLPTYFEELPIPRRFVQKFRKELSDVLFLKGPSGRVWRVGLKETDGIVYFLNGWKEFIEHHSLWIGYLLVFRYDGNSQFNVQIFDRSACEKEYPDASESDEGSFCNKGSCAPEQESDDSVEILGVSKVDGRNLRTTKRGDNRRVLRSSLRLQYNALKMKLNCETESKGDNNNKRKNTSEEHLSQSESRRFKSGKSIGSENLQQCHLLSTVQQGCIRSIQSNGKEIMESIHKNVSNCYKEKVSSEPTPMALENQSTESCMPSSGEKTSVNLENQQTEPDGLSSSSEDVKYLQEQREGFVPVNGRVNCRYVSKRRNMTTEWKQKALQETTNFNSDKPFFIVAMTPTYVLRRGACMQIPSNFVRDHISRQPEYVSLEYQGGRKWLIGCRYRENGAILLARGWSGFVSENNIVEGDVCAFELVDRKNIGLKVTVYPADEVLPLNQLSLKLAVKKRSHI